MLHVGHRLRGPSLAIRSTCGIPVVPLVWDVAVTFTADFQKIVGPISYFATASKYQALIDGGTLEGEALVNAKAALSNAYLDGVLSVFFMVMMGVFLVVGIYQTVKILAKGKFGVETTSEEPFVESEMVRTVPAWSPPSSKRRCSANTRPRAMSWRRRNRPRPDAGIHHHGQTNLVRIIESQGPDSSGMCANSVEKRNTTTIWSISQANIPAKPR